MKYVSIKDRTFSKVVCGTNAFYGRSHFSVARSLEYEGRCTDEYMARVLATCVRHGVNAVESCANDRILPIVRGVGANGAAPLRFIGNTRIDATSAMKSHHQKLAYLIERRSDICVIHSQFVDRPRSDQEIKGLVPLLDKIHAAGLLAGISTHRVSTVRLCEERGYPVDVYMFPLNATGYVYPGYEGSETVIERVDLVTGCPKPFILMKALGAGRIAPDEGLPFVLSHCKPEDIISLGLSSIEEAEESLALVEKHL